MSEKQKIKYAIEEILTELNKIQKENKNSKNESFTKKEFNLSFLNPDIYDITKFSGSAFLDNDDNF